MSGRPFAAARRLRPGCANRPAALPPDIRWRQRFANFCQALDQLETFFQPPALVGRERQGLIRACEDCFVLGWHSLRSHTHNRVTAEQVSQQVRTRPMPRSDIDFVLLAQGLRHGCHLRQYVARMGQRLQLK